MTLSLVLCLMGAYLLGSIPTGLILSKLAAAQDIRDVGSGNIGAANVARVIGFKYGLLTLLGDALKGFVPAWVGAALFHSSDAACLIGAAAFAGHLFPVYLRFKGGKGVATCFGVLLYLAPAAALIAAALFATIVAASRYVSLGSLAGAVVTPVLIALFDAPLPVLILGICMGLCIVIRHRDNIRRLVRGRENRIGGKPRSEAEHD